MIKLSSKRKQHYSFILILPPQLPSRYEYGSGTGSIPFPQAPARAREYSADGGDQASFGVVGGHVDDVLDV